MSFLAPEDWRRWPWAWRPGFAAAVIGLMLLTLCASPQGFAAGRTVNLSAADGTPLVGMLYEASPRPAPAVLLVHMLGRSKDEWAAFAEQLQAVGMTALAIDLRGHGRSGGNGSELAAMTADVRGALTWLSSQSGVRPGDVAIVGASLGANLAALAATEAPTVRSLALISPSLDYRGVRLDASVMKKIGDRPVWLTASTQDPYALRTVKELAGESPAREQHLSPVRGHGTALFAADQDLTRALVDWLRRTLIF